MNTVGFMPYRRPVPFVRHGVPEICLQSLRRQLWSAVWRKGMGVFRRIGIIPLAAARRRRRILLCMILFFGGGFGETSNQDICAKSGGIRAAKR